MRSFLHLLVQMYCLPFVYILLQSESLVSLQSKVECKIHEVTVELDDTKSLLAQVGGGGRERRNWRWEGEGGKG